MQIFCSRRSSSKVDEKTGQKISRKTWYMRILIFLNVWTATFLYKVFYTDYARGFKYEHWCSNYECKIGRQCGMFKTFFCMFNIFKGAFLVVQTLRYSWWELLSKLFYDIGISEISRLEKLSKIYLLALLSCYSWNFDDFFSLVAKKINFV